MYHNLGTNCLLSDFCNVSFERITLLSDLCFILEIFFNELFKV